MTTSAPWFATTPEAVLRAEGILVAFLEGRLDDIGTTLAQDYAEGATPLHTVVALIAMCDRLADGFAQAHGFEQREVIREAARVVAAAYYSTTDNS